MGTTASAQASPPLGLDGVVARKEASLIIRLSNGEEIARALRVWRKEAKFNQRQMASMLGVSQSTYSRWERNAIKPPACFVMDGQFAGFSAGELDGPCDYVDAGE